MTESPSFSRVLRRIRQVRQFTDAKVPPEVLQDLLEIARWTGSARNVQPWAFLVIEDRADLTHLASIGPSSAFFAGAPLVILPLIEEASPTPAFDEGRLVERLFTGAAAHGLGAGIGSFPPARRAEVATYLQVPETYQVARGVAIGRPAAPPARSGPVGSGRKPLTDLIHYGRFGNPDRQGASTHDR